jgi:hypothetical protein
MDLALSAASDAQANEPRHAAEPKNADRTGSLRLATFTLGPLMPNVSFATTAPSSFSLRCSTSGPHDVARSKMTVKIFLSWSGEQSRRAALALRAWLPNVFQDLDVWMSQHDLAAGKRWPDTLDKELATTNVGILCLTTESVTSAWLLFEAGALAKEVSASRVIPYRLGISDTTVNLPLARFQSVSADRDGTLSLLKSINDVRAHKFEAARVAELFDTWWPTLSAELEPLTAQGQPRYPIGGTSPFEGPHEKIPEDAMNKFQSSAGEGLDILGHSLSGLFQKPGGRKSILNALSNGATVRVLFLDPTSPSSDQLEQISKRVGEELKKKITASMMRALKLKEGLKDDLAALAVRNDLIDTAQSRLQLAASRLISYANIQRADNAMLVSHYSQSIDPGKKAPTRELLKNEDAALFDFYYGEFERVWSDAIPIEEILSQDGLFADRSRVLNHVDDIRRTYSRVALRNEQVPLPFPKMLVVLPNMGCEIRCKNCFTWNAAPHGQSMMSGNQMSLSLFRLLVDQAIEMKVSCFELSGGGEPLEHLEVARLIEIAKVAQRAGVRVGVLSNGNALVKRPDLIGSVLNLDYIRLGYTEYLDSQKDERIEEFRNLLRNLGNQRNDCKSSLRIGVKLLLTRSNAESGPNGQSGLTRIGRTLKSMLDLRTIGGHRFVVDHVKIKSLRGTLDIEPHAEQVRRVEHEVAIIKANYGERAIDVQVDVKSARVNHETYKCWINPIMSVIDASGNVYLCCNFYEMPESTRVATFLQNGVHKFADFWGKEHHLASIHRVPVNGVCNSKFGCNCRLVHYQELVEPYVRYSLPVSGATRVLFPVHCDIL